LTPYARLFLGDAIALLQFVDEVVAVTFTAVDVLVRELAPLRLDSLGQKRPPVSDHVLNHFIDLSWFLRLRRRTAAAL
jgi:hypothetical protein